MTSMLIWTSSELVPHYQVRLDLSQALHHYFAELLSNIVELIWISGILYVNLREIIKLIVMSPMTQKINVCM